MITALEKNVYLAVCKIKIVFFRKIVLTFVFMVTLVKIF